MSRVMRAIDAKSFIIGVLSAVVVVMAMGAKMQGGTSKISRRNFEHDVEIAGIPFAVEDGKIYYVMR